MGAQKLSVEEIQNLSYIPKELAVFWQAYFSELSIGLSRLFYKYLKDSATVRYMHRDLVDSKVYFDAVGESSIVKSFALNSNASEMGFLLFSKELCYFLVQSMLGGKNLEHYDFDPVKMGTLDPMLIEGVLKDILKLIEKDLSFKSRDQFFHIISSKKSNEALFCLKDFKIVSIQQFMCIVGNQSFVFDIAFTYNFLEKNALS